MIDNLLFHNNICFLELILWLYSGMSNLLRIFVSISEHLFKTVFELQPRQSGCGGGQSSTREERIKIIVDEIMEKMPDAFAVTDLLAKCEEKTPYILVCFQAKKYYFNIFPNMLKID